MTLYSILQAAEEIGVDPRRAALLRLRYLQDEILALEGEIRFGRHLMTKNSKWVRNTGEMNIYMAQQDMVPLKTEAQTLLDFLNGKMKSKKPGEEITSDMIVRARQHPLADLIGQEPKGSSMVVCCPFHSDKGPSASVKNNVLYCFAGCRPKKEGRKGWDPILLLMERDGMSFPAAVKALQ